MFLEKSQSFEKVNWWVRFYSYITFAAIIYGIIAAHLPSIIGYTWSSCEFCDCKFVCALVFHLYETPLVFYSAFVAWYGLKKFSVETIHNYGSLLTYAIVSSLVFFTFETILLLESVRNNLPAWESYGLTSVALILVGGAGLGIYVKQKLISYLYQSNKA